MIDHILIWPTSHGPPSPQSKEAAALLGWQYNNEAGGSQIRITVVAGSVPISHSNQSATAANNSDARTCYRRQKVQSALDAFVPCGSCCRECPTCVASSLCIVDLSSKQGDRPTPDKNEGHAAGRGQLILYDPQQAREWHARWPEHHHSNGLWDDILLQVGISSQVMAHLYKDVLDSKNDLQKKLSQDDVTACRNCQHSSSKHLEQSNRDTLANRSLLLLHWKTCEIRATSCQDCRGHPTSKSSINNGSFFSPVNAILSSMRMTIPLCTLIQVLSFHSLGGPRHRREQVNHHYTKQTLTIAALAIDVTLGWILGFACLTNHTSMIEIASRLYGQYQHIWNCGLTWLQSNPLGVKMNEALTEQVVLLTEWILHHHPLLSLSPPITPFPYATSILSIVGILTIIFGSRFFFAWAFDTFRLLFLHVHLLSHFFARLQSLEWSILSSLWLLFRGKKRNVLRLRSDHLHYDHMQLLLGMLLFSICIFLFTTVLVHHWFFAVVEIMHELVIGGFWLGFAGVEGLFCVDRLLWEGRGEGCGDVHLTSASLNDDLVRRNIDDNAFYMRSYFGETDRYNDANQAMDTIIISPNVRIERFPYVVSRMTFPVTSDSNIVIKALTSFVTSRLVRMAVFLPRMMASASCEILCSCVKTSALIQQKQLSAGEIIK